MAVKIQLRGDTAANWTSVNPVLAHREIGVETDTRLMKIGDGATVWNSLSYTASDPTSISDASETVKGKVELATTAEAVTGTDTVRAVTPAGVKAAIDALIDAAPGALNTLNELATALGDDPNFSTTVVNALATKAPLAGSKIIGIAFSDTSTPITTGAGKVKFRMPSAMTVTEVRASLDTAQTSGSIFTVDINENGASILSTKLTINNTEKSSVSATTPAVISDAALADDSEITIDVDQVGDGTAVGGKVWLIGY